MRRLAWWPYVGLEDQRSIFEQKFGRRPAKDDPIFQKGKKMVENGK